MKYNDKLSGLRYALEDLKLTDRQAASIVKQAGNFRKQNKAAKQARKQGKSVIPGLPLGDVRVVVNGQTLGRVDF